MELQENLMAERIAVKLTYAHDVLHNVIGATKNLETSERKVLRYLRQTNLLLLWRRGNGAMQVVGSTAKTVGAVAVIASSVSPRLQMAVKVGQKLWKFGTGLKLLSSITEILKELWQKGCRECLLEFTKQTAHLAKNLGVFNELVTDLRQNVDNLKNAQNLDTPEKVWNVISSFVPDSQRTYIPHIICMAMGCQSYSPLFDFAALTTDPANESNISRLMREIESLRFLEFSQESDSKELIAIGTFLHVARELLDFLDGFKKLTDSDCLFLQQCLTRFSEEFMKIKTVVSFLKNLKSMKAEMDRIGDLNVPDENKDNSVTGHLVCQSDSDRDLVDLCNTNTLPGPSSSNFLQDPICEEQTEDKICVTGSPVIEKIENEDSVYFALCEKQEDSAFMSSCSSR